MITINKFTVTLAALRKAGACVDGYNRLVRSIQGREFTDEDVRRKAYIRLAHAEPISIRTILDSNGLDDALWALRCIDDADKDNDVRLFAVWCARQVEHMMRDKRSMNALDVAERYANGKATDSELSAARGAARAAAWDAARGAAWDAAWAAAYDAARGAAWAAARGAAGDAARSAARGAARGAQKNRLIEMFEAGAFLATAPIHDVKTEEAA